MTILSLFIPFPIHDVPSHNSSIVPFKISLNFEAYHFIILQYLWSPYNGEENCLWSNDHQLSLRILQTTEYHLRRSQTLLNINPNL